MGSFSFLQTVTFRQVAGRSLVGYICLLFENRLESTVLFPPLLSVQRTSKALWSAI